MPRYSPESLRPPYSIGGETPYNASSYRGSLRKVKELTTLATSSVDDSVQTSLRLTGSAVDVVYDYGGVQGFINLISSDENLTTIGDDNGPDIIINPGTGGTTTIEGLAFGAVGLVNHVHETNTMSTTITSSMTTLGGTETLLLPAGWSSMTVLAICSYRASVGAGDVVLLRAAVIIDSNVQTERQLTITNDRASASNIDITAFGGLTGVTGNSTIGIQGADALSTGATATLNQIMAIGICEASA